MYTIFFPSRFCWEFHISLLIFFSSTLFFHISFFYSYSFFFSFCTFVSLFFPHLFRLLVLLISFLLNLDHLSCFPYFSLFSSFSLPLLLSLLYFVAFLTFLSSPLSSFPYFPLLSSLSPPLPLSSFFCSSLLHCFPYFPLLFVSSPPFSVSTEPKCYVDTGVCKVTWSPDTLRTTSLYVPAVLLSTIVWIGLVSILLINSVFKRKSILWTKVIHVFSIFLFSLFIF